MKTLAFNRSPCVTLDKRNQQLSGKGIDRWMFVALRNF
nr:MAG TPA: hypothetical protein [Caudoviricetes sp.]